ncbi:hypothetical protein [Celeribacter sp.]|uniref:hypothetical protein n=1 Tax=Celeribacter sp. TaxID=1890673 RepID=UPI003A934CFC
MVGDYRKTSGKLAGARVVALSDYAIDAAKSVQADLALDAVVYATGEELIAAEDVDATLV